MTNDFITFLDYTQAEIVALLDLADELREAWRAQAMPQNLRGKSLALIWDAGGFRNRVSFELGIAAMGGISTQVSGTLDERESIEDVAAYLDNWCDGIVARTRTHEHMLRLAAASSAPVINARTNFNHPCETLGDLAYLRAQKSPARALDGLKVVFVGEATNLCYPWLEAAARLPIEVVQVCPPGYEADAALLARLQADAVGSLRVSHDLDSELRGAHVVYTDCWPKRSNLNEANLVAQRFLPYQITADRLRQAAEDVLFLPCPPVTRGEEVAADAMEQFGRTVFAAKEYLLHAQNAVLTTLL